MTPRVGSMIAPLLVMVVALLSGCGGAGQTIALDLDMPGTGESTAKPETLTVGVAPFDDARSDRTRLGVHQDFWGTERYFDVAGNKPGEKVAAVVTEFLRSQHGWNAKPLAPSDGIGSGSTPAATPAMNKPSGSPNVMLSGKVLELSANAEGKLLRTKITVGTKILVQGVNVADGSTVRMTLNGAGSQTVFWFEPEDVQALLRDVLNESLMKLAAETKVDGKVLRLK